MREFISFVFHCRGWVGELYAVSRGPAFFFFMPMSESKGVGSLAVSTSSLTSNSDFRLARAHESW
jgi:hypothetical protein